MTDSDKLILVIVIAVIIGVTIAIIITAWRAGDDEPQPRADVASVEQDDEVKAQASPVVASSPQVAPAPAGEVDGVAMTGIFVALIGFALMLYFMVSFRISVEAGHSTSVNNMGLISDRESGMLLGGFLFVGGCVLFAGRRGKP